MAMTTLHQVMRQAPRVFPPAHVGDYFEALERGDHERLALYQSEDPERHEAKLGEARRMVAARVAAEAFERKHARSERLRTAGAKLRDEALDAVVDGNPDLTEAVSAVRGWWANRKTPWLVLSGSAGTGKTVAIADLIADHGGMWMRAPDLVRTFVGNFGDPEERRQRAFNVNLLAIDDVGVGEKDAERTELALLELFDERPSARETPTIMSSNLMSQPFAKLYPNDRLHSRMAELVTWVSLKPGDLRRKRGAK